MPDSLDTSEAPALDAIALTELAAELVASYVARNRVSPAELPALIATLHASLAGLGKAPEPEPAAAKLTPPVPIRKTVTDTHIISLEDGKPYKILKRHLGKLGLTPDAYRVKWGLPKDYPMTAPAASLRRSAIAKKLGLGALGRKR